MIDPHGDAIIKRAALFLFVAALVICGIAWRAATDFQPPTAQMGAW